MEQSSTESPSPDANMPQTSYADEVNSSVKNACDSAIKCFDLMLKKPSYKNNSNLMHELIKPYALLGYPRAMICFATTYRFGFGVEKDLSKASEWYYEAVKKGSTFALIELFKLYHFSNVDVGLEIKDQFVNVFEKEKDDDVRICKAIMYYEDKLVPQDIDKSIEILGRLKKIKDVWTKDVCKIAIAGAYSGYPIVHVLNNCLKVKEDLENVQTLSMISREYLYVCLIEEFIKGETSYLNYVSKKNIKVAITDDFNAIVNITNKNRSKCLMNSSNIARTMNSILNCAQSKRLLTDDDVKEIFMGLKMNDGNLAVIQSLLYELLHSFDAFCNEHGITYFIACGSLLGAYRHEGFIPWDDDIDIYMMSEDYEKLKKEINGSILWCNDVVYYNKQYPAHGVGMTHRVGFRHAIGKDPFNRIITLDIITFDYVESTTDEFWNTYIQEIKSFRQTIDSFAKEDFMKNESPTNDSRIKACFVESRQSFKNSMNGQGKKAVGLMFDNPGPGEMILNPDPVRKLFDYGDFFPVRRMKFGPIVVSAPNNYLKILDVLYRGSKLRFSTSMLYDVHVDKSNDALLRMKPQIDQLKELKTISSKHI